MEKEKFENFKKAVRYWNNQGKKEAKALPREVRKTLDPMQIPELKEMADRYKQEKEVLGSMCPIGVGDTFLYVVLFVLGLLAWRLGLLTRPDV